MEELKNLDWPELIEKLEHFATSEAARAKLRTLKPLPNEDSASQSLRAIREAQSVLSFGERPFMESLDLFPTWFSRLKREATLKTMELKDVRRFCLEVVALDEVLRPLDSSWVKDLKKRLMDAIPTLSAIDHLMTPSGEIRTDASEALHNLYKEKASQTRSLQTVLDRLVKANDMEPVLQDRFVTTREGRWVIPVKGGMQHAFPGIIHDASQSKQTVFMEPDEVIPLNNRLRQIDIEIDQEVDRLLKALSEYLFTVTGKFESSAEVLLEADFRLAQAMLAEVLSATEPKFNTNKIDLIDVRHPLLALQSGKVIPNTVRLDPSRRILLLSGPNAGGKTVLLKSIALASQMARCGMPICAESGSSLPFFTDLYVGIGDAQSVDAQLSTFAAHLKVLNSALGGHGPQQLLLIDEICGSTDPEEGSALARSFISHYAANGVFGIITSHLGPLKVGWTADSGVVNGSLEYDSKSGNPTYQFFMGVPGQSLALQTARRVGVAESVLNAAMDFLSPATKLYQQHLNDIESMKDELAQLKRSLFEETLAAREKKRIYTDLVQKFKNEREQWMERVVRKAEKKVDDLIEKANVENLFRRHDKAAQIKNELPQVVKASTATATRRRLETVEDFERAYPPGSVVFVTSIGQDGVVQGKANGKGEIPVLSNSMRIFVHWEQLRPPQNSSNPTGQIIRRSSGVTVTLQDQERVIDLRGKPVDDALGQLEMQLDAAALNNEDRVKIVHGHGTETLKKAVRSHLSRSVYVKKWKAAPPEIGGDGVTWAELKD